MDDDELTNVLERFGGFISTRGLDIQLMRGGGSLEQRINAGDKIDSSLLRSLFTDWQQQNISENQFDVLNRVIGKRDESLDIAELGEDLSRGSRERIIPTGEPESEFRWVENKWALFKEGVMTEVFSPREPVVRIEETSEGRFMVYYNPDTEEVLARRKLE